MLSQAQALSDMGMGESALPLWAAAAAYEERIAPLLEAMDHPREAAAHRVSAASCFQRTMDWSRAVNLYRAALASPLSGEVRREVKKLLAECLAKLAEASRKTA
ncbi:MAG: hypothetical protein HY721_07600 [Planctomycetes bacterium]|nr:hypothetical protein [Planctomycetota bacterium]